MFKGDLDDDYHDPKTTLCDGLEAEKGKEKLEWRGLKFVSLLPCYSLSVYNAMPVILNQNSKRMRFEHAKSHNENPKPRVIIYKFNVSKSLFTLR